MANPYSGIEKSVGGVAKAVSELRKTEERAAVDVDLLTSEEVEELRLLIEHKDDIESFATSRIGELGQKLEGMYTELCHLGLIDKAGGVPVFVNPMAYWAVEKHAQRTAEKQREEMKAVREERSRRRFEVMVTVLAGLMGIIGTVIGVLMTAQQP